jgi:hypothetical protein
MIVRYADDTVCGFQHEADARAFLADLRARMGRFALSLHPEKTRLIEFGGQSMAADAAHRASQAQCSICRQTPKVGAACVNCARSDRSGGRPETGVPTAILIWGRRYAERSRRVRSTPFSAAA